MSSWVSGGAVPAARRGTVHGQGLAHICDWYATFAFLAGVDATDGKAAQHEGIPPIDSTNLWTAIITGAS